MTSRDERDEVVEIAQGMLSGAVGIVEGCRRMVPLLARLDSRVRQSEAARVVVAVESETDEFPLGEQRRLWATDALQERDVELNAYLAIVRSGIEESCRALIAMLECM